MHGCVARARGNVPCTDAGKYVASVRDFELAPAPDTASAGLLATDPPRYTSTRDSKLVAVTARLVDVSPAVHALALRQRASVSVADGQIDDLAELELRRWIHGVAIVGLREDITASTPDFASRRSGTAPSHPEAELDHVCEPFELVGIVVERVGPPGHRTRRTREPELDTRRRAARVRVWTSRSGSLPWRPSISQTSVA